MSKNLTRKGLAFGALVALASTVIAGTPASAAGEINVAPSAGTSYNTIAGADFVLATTFAPGFSPAAYAQLKYLVKTDANSTVKAAASITSAAAAITAAGNATAIAISTTSSAVAGGLTAATDVSYLALDAQTDTVTSTTEVTAFVDSNNDGALSAGEWNTVKSVSFKKAADLAPVVTLTAPKTADTSVKATVVWGDLNVEQISDETVKFTVGTQISSATAGTLASGVWSSSVTALAAAEAVTARAYIGSTALGSAAVSGSASARTISQPVSGPVTGDNAVAATAAQNVSATVRTNSAFSIAATVKDVASTPVVKAGVAVVATITPSGSLSTTRTLSVNGTVYNGSVAIPTVSLVTDAAGQVKVDLATVGFAATQTVNVSFTAENYTTTTTATLADASFTLAETTASGSSLRSIAEGGSTTFNYTVKDQFGVAITAGRLVSTIGYTTSATVYTPLVGGAAAVTVTDTTASVATSISVSTVYQTQGSDSNWSNAGSAVATTVGIASQADAFDFAPAAATAAVATAATITGSVRNPGSAVTASAAGVTFTHNGKDYVDSVTFVTGALSNGDFTLTAKSNTVGAKTITFTNTEVKTAVLTVSAATPSAGKTLTITAPTTSLPGRTVPVVVTLVDAYGNPVDTTATTTDGQVTVTVSGIGTYTTVAGDTDSAGKVSFNVILPSTDSGAVTITAKYDSNGATADVAGTTVSTSVTSVITVGTPEAVAKIGTANGRVYVNVKDGKGSVVSVKIGSKWVTKTALNNDYTFSYKNTKGKKVAVKVYVDGDLSAAKTITVK